MRPVDRLHIATPWAVKMDHIRSTHDDRQHETVSDTTHKPAVFAWRVYFARYEF